MSRKIGGVATDPKRANMPLDIWNPRVLSALALKCGACKFWNKGRCPFSAKYVGHQVTEIGMKPSTDKPPVQLRHDEKGVPICSMFVLKDADKKRDEVMRKATLPMFGEIWRGGEPQKVGKLEVRK